MLQGGCPGFISDHEDCIESCMSDVELILNLVIYMVYK